MAKSLMVTNGGGFYEIDLATGSRTLLRDFNETFTDVAVSPSGDVFATTFDGIYKINLEAGTREYLGPTSSSTNGLAIEASGRYAFTSSNTSSRIEKFDLTTGKSVGFVDYTGYPSEGDLVLQGGSAFLLDSNRSLVQIDLTTGAQISSFSHGIPSAYGLSSSGSTFYIYSWEGLYSFTPGSNPVLISGQLDLDGSVYGASNLPAMQRNGSESGDVISGTIWDDVVYGRGGNDVISAKRGDDRVFGGAGNDTLQGGTGNDWLDGGSGTDRLEGGAGNDVYVLANAGDIVLESANAGTDQVRVGYSYTLSANVENLLLTGSANLNGTGNGLGNQLMGNAGHNVLSGHAGNDTLQGGEGDDALYGGNGNDRLAGGIGNDTLLGEGGNDLLDGGDGNNNLNAGSGDDTLLSGAGSDTINAGAGNDRVTAGAGGDRVFGLDGNDTIDSGAGHDIVIGGAGNDLLRGGDGNDDLAAEVGSDTLDGGAGNDMLRGGQGADLFIFNDGLDTIRNFDSAQDRIDLRSFSGLNTWADVQDHLQQEGGHVIFRHGDDVLRIDWTQLAALGSDDFVW